MAKRKSLLITITAILVLLLAARAALPSVVQWYVNGRLDSSDKYDGRIGDVDLHLYRGAYQINDVEIFNTEGEVPVPLFSAPTVDFSLLWSALLNGSLVGEVVLEAPGLNIVDSETEANQQTGAEENWFAIIEDLFPFRIDQVLINDGQLHFRNFESEPPVDVYLTAIQGTARNLTNSQQLAESLVASIDIQALTRMDGRLAVAVELDPSQEPPAFDLNARLLNLPLIALDDLIDAYAPFDVEAGTLDVVVEMAAKEGQLEGYVKPIIHGLEVFEWREDVEREGNNPFQILWEALVGGVAELLENQPRDQIASQVPFSGSLENPESSVLVTIGNILRNAFVEAFQANIDGTISLEDFEVNTAQDAQEQEEWQEGRKKQEELEAKEEQEDQEAEAQAQ